MTGSHVHVREGLSFRGRVWLSVVVLTLAGPVVAHSVVGGLLSLAAAIVSAI